MNWLPVVAMASLGLATACALVIGFDVTVLHPQKMKIMNIVWPITALYFGPLALWAYFRLGRNTARVHASHSSEPGATGSRGRPPTWRSVALAATHCGSGCTLGDFVAEGVIASVPLQLFGHKLFAAWCVDYLFAFAFGIAFQYFTIVPMRHLSVGEGISAALKADSLSLTAWQVGMYGWMAFATFVLFGTELKADDPMFWFMMQIAMIAGFFTSLPVNWWLLRSGAKEAM